MQRRQRAAEPIQGSVFHGPAVEGHAGGAAGKRHGQHGSAGRSRLRQRQGEDGRVHDLCSLCPIDGQTDAGIYWYK